MPNAPCLILRVLKNSTLAKAHKNYILTYPRKIRVQNNLRYRFYGYKLISKEEMGTLVAKISIECLARCNNQSIL